MQGGGRPGRVWQECREAFLHRDVSVARLLAFITSLTVHLLAIAAFVTMPDHRSKLGDNHLPVLTVVTLEPARPVAEQTSPPKPARHDPLLEVAPTQPTKPKMDALASGQAVVSSRPSSAPVPHETGIALEEVVPSHNSGRSRPRDELDTALSEYQAALWRKIDANRPRGVNLSGTVLILFQLSENGELRSADVSQSSGNILLDKIALRSVRRAAPFPLPPKGIPDAALTFKIPINFR